MNYNAMQSAAKRLIGANGTRCTLKNPSSDLPIYNSNTNEYEITQSSYEGVCIISGYEDNLVDGTVIKAGDRKVIAVLVGEPKPGLSSLEVYDKAGALKETYKVINCNPISPNASVVIVYRLQCRK